MVDDMKKVAALNFGRMQPPFGLAYKNVIGARHAAWRINVEKIKIYAARIDKEIKRHCFRHYYRVTRPSFPY